MQEKPRGIVIEARVGAAAFGEGASPRGAGRRLSPRSKRGHCLQRFAPEEFLRARRWRSATHCAGVKRRTSAPWKRPYRQVACGSAPNRLRVEARRVLFKISYNKCVDDVCAYRVRHADGRRACRTSADGMQRKR